LSRRLYNCLGARVFFVCLGARIYHCLGAREAKKFAEKRHAGILDRWGWGQRGFGPEGRRTPYSAALPRQSTHVGRDNPYLGTYRRVHPCGTIAGCQSCLAGPAADEPPNGQSDHKQHKCGSSSGKQVCGRESERRRRRRREGIVDGGCMLSAVAPGRPTTQPWAPICRLWTREKAERTPRVSPFPRATRPGVGRRLIAPTLLPAPAGRVRR
jgi:hypothetical protein